MKRRDLSQAQFEARARKLGFQKEFMGYWRLASAPNVHVYPRNAGDRRRDQLRYLIACDKREQTKAAATN